MTATAERGINCTVEGAAKLPSELGGEAAICSTMAKIVLPSLQRTGIASSALAVVVKVKSDSRISAVASVNGKTLPEQNVASSDRPLGATAIEMLANGVAAELSNLASGPNGGMND